jgi:hypothetical protein
MSIDVRLPRGTTPVFPDACCACGRERPGDTLVFRGRRIHLAELFMPWLWFFGKREQVAVPVCGGCRPLMSGGRRWRLVVLIVALAVAIPLVDHGVKLLVLGRGTKRLVTLLGEFVALTPLLLWWVFHPPVFDITVGKDHVDYEFASRGYAERFLAANAGATSNDLPRHR